MIRVLHVIDSFDLGGAQTVILNLVRALDRSEFQLEVAAMHGAGPFKARLEAAGIPVHSLSRAKFPPEYLGNLPGLLARGNFQVVHFHLFGANWIAKPLTALLSDAVRIVHDHCNDALRYENPLACWVDRLTNRLSDHIFCVSESTRDFLRAHERIPEEKLSVLANAVDTAEFRPVSAEVRRAARQKFALPAEARIIGGVGRLVPQKNFSRFLEIARLMPEAVFVIAGTGPLEAELKSAAPANVRFLGFVEDRPGLYAALDALLLTSLYEGMPMTVLEAMAAGVPVVSTKVDGVAEAFRDGREARILEGAAAADFAVALRELPSQQDRLSAAARERIERDFSIAASARRLAEVYRLHLGIASGPGMG